MALGYEFAEWHLTSDGWQRGTHQLDSQSVRRVEPPAGRVKTVRYHEEIVMRSGGGMRQWTEVVWVGDADDAARLEGSFGPCPEQIVP